MPTPLESTVSGQQTALDALLEILGASGQALGGPAASLGNILQRQQEGVNALIPAATGSPTRARLSATAGELAQGRLPGLNDPELKARLDTIFGAKELDIQRFLDTSLFDTINRARGLGYAGGLEILREGTPGAMMAPALAEATRQKGTLAGQRAATEVDLATVLPGLAANLETSSLGPLLAALQGTAGPAQTSLGAFGTLLNQPTQIANLFNQALIGQTGAVLGAGQLQQRGGEAFQNFLTNLIGTQRQQPGSTTTQQTSSSIMDALGSLAGVSGGIGQLLFPLALMSGGIRPPSLSGV